MTVYCINSKCPRRKNADYLEFCKACDTPLTIKNRYRLLRPLRPLNAPNPTEIFEIQDLGADAIKGKKYKVLKILRRNNTYLVQLFKQEAEILKKLNHPGIPKVPPEDDYFTVSFSKRRQLHCLVMEKVEGENLQSWLKHNNQISEDKAIEWLKQLLEMLDALHQEQYFHRDIKPSNVMLRPNGQLVLIDFGTVCQMTGTIVQRLMGKDVTGEGVFSPGYTPPEQINGKAVPQSDLYALGRTFVHLLTGIHPLKLNSDDKTGQLIWRKHTRKISEPLAEWIDYLMDPFVYRRPPNASFVLQHLKKKPLLHPPDRTLPSSPPPWLIILNLVLFSLLLVTGVLWLQAWQQHQRRMAPETISQVDKLPN
ncbi:MULTISPECIES: serine/threonine protein kinase [unclassified Coleofasciculus]|uniref:serine/threonine protein kinase n=1 Tax=unclassified Coleofasciculus TaxID=2692782 RepID=UPI00187F38DD|nr:MULTISPECIES: serine/threonine-protein kinase [unclassified Coleofasciculus]MBE9126521.1 serine/threonine protein kinase [Coleofasciculus sp. LEGE 07081]MBE9149955.1 serine/threonine protein kinase [Coleofasciculus sp. LEGE 07092]